MPSDDSDGEGSRGDDPAESDADDAGRPANGGSDPVDAGQDPGDGAGSRGDPFSDESSRPGDDSTAGDGATANGGPEENLDSGRHDDGGADSEEPEDELATEEPEDELDTEESSGETATDESIDDVVTEEPDGDDGFDLAEPDDELDLTEPDADDEPESSSRAGGTDETDGAPDDESDGGQDPDDEEFYQPTARVGEYDWEDFKGEFYYDDEGRAPEDEEFRPEEYLGFDPGSLEEVVGAAGAGGRQLTDVANERTVRVNPELDEDAFFTAEDGTTTAVNRYDLEKAVPQEKKHHFREVDRYWVNKPYAFVVIFHSEKENEKKYYLVEPHLTPIESDLREFISGKLKTAIKYSSDDVIVQGDEDARADVIERETHNLLERYDLYDEGARPDDGGMLGDVKELLGLGGDDDAEGDDGPSGLQGVEARPEPDVLEEDSETLTEYQIEKILYLLKRDFIGFERIDGIKHDINVEDISCDGYNSPVFVYHGDYEQIITNVYHGEEELDEFVVKMAQRSGKGISKRSPQVDATLPDGSRSQLTLGREVSDHGTNYTIRQFKDVPFTPIDLINWNTFSLEEMAFLWLCIENHKSLIFAGGTASGKTTSLNAVSLFIPSKAKIVSIEDTREVELPQRNWIASVTRPSFSDGDKGDVDEFDLLEAALRQRPEYIVMGEIRGEEGRTLFQVMSTGHTTLTTFHADSVGEVIKRFTTDPINVSKTMFTALDLVSIQTSTRVQGSKVRRNKSLTEINHYDPENDEINVQDVYQWQAETDEFLQMGESNTLDEIMFDRGWSREHLEEEIFVRELVLAYLIRNGLNTYTQVAATLQAFINDQETILALIANDDLERSLEDLREMESVEIDIDPEKEAMVPRPSASEEMIEETTAILESAEGLLEEYRGEELDSDLADALEIDAADDIDPTDPDGGGGEDFSYGGFSFEAGDGTGDGEATTDGGSTTSGSTGAHPFERAGEPDTEPGDERGGDGDAA